MSAKKTPKISDEFLDSMNHAARSEGRASSAPPARQAVSGNAPDDLEPANQGRNAIPNQDGTQKSDEAAAKAALQGGDFAENREAARQGNPPSSSYSSANRQGVERARREAADQPGSEYHGEAVAAQEGKLTNTPQRGAAGRSHSRSHQAARH